MNIFFLDRDPAKAAGYHCDQHIVKMAVEYAQLLSTALHETGSTLNEWVYKPTHQHHPCSIWVAQSLSHWAWLWKLGHHVGNEYTRRYHKIHQSTRVLRCLPVPNKLPELGWLSDPPQAMPDEYKAENTVVAYRNFYLKDKVRFARWHKSTPPTWWHKTLTQEEKV
jgi:hypothetical protein